MHCPHHAGQYHSPISPSQAVILPYYVLTVSCFLVAFRCINWHPSNKITSVYYYNSQYLPVEDKAVECWIKCCAPSLPTALVLSISTHGAAFPQMHHGTKLSYPMVHLWEMLHHEIAEFCVWSGGGCSALSNALANSRPPL